MLFTKSVLTGDGHLSIYTTFSEVEMMLIYTYDDFTTVYKYVKPKILHLNSQPKKKNETLQKLEFRIREVASQVLYTLHTAHRDPDFE